MPPWDGNEFTRAGTAAHALGEEALRSGKALDELDVDPSIAGDLAAVQTYVDYVRALEAGGYHVLLEQRLQLGPAELGLFGTADCVARHGERLVIADYKHGSGVAVSPVENSQLLTYAAAALTDPAVNTDDVTEIELVIIQPRCREGEPIQAWTTDAERLVEHTSEVLEARKLSLSPNPPAEIGEHCRWCQAKAICPDLLAAAGRLPTLDKVQKGKLGEALELAATLEHWIEGVRGAAHKHMENGGTLDGWKLVPKRASRRWIDNGDAITYLESAGLKSATYLEEKLVSPAQLEKKVSPETYQPIDAAVVVKQSSGTTLARADDPRNEVGGAGSKAARAARKVKALGLLT
jgi:hypothetical protein